MPDTRTVEAYGLQANELAALYRRVIPPFLRRVVAAMTPGGSLLDIGCGSGRDLAAFAEEGFTVHGVEPVEAFRLCAEQAYPTLRGRIAAGSLPDQIPFPEASFDGIHCAAVLMHLAAEEWLNAIFSVRALLKPGGVLHISISPTREGLDPNHRGSDGRLFTPIQPEHIRALIQRAGFSIISEEQAGDMLGRTGIEWISILARKCDDHSNRPLQRIERIVNHDNKDATYKLALMRALADLAGTQFNRAKWIGNAKVALPSDLVVDQWIRYYWPLFDGNHFIAQKNGEHQGCAKPISFRNSLTQLITQFSSVGGYPTYRDALVNAPALDKVARKKIREAIRNGPIVFASGNQFSWQTIDSAPHIVMPAELWSELGDLHHWIEPAIRLQWAEETCRMSKQAFTTGEILSLLSTEFSPERDTLFARQIFSSHHQRLCTWSNKPLGPQFDIDHIIPYSLWHDNSLWNLVPAVPSVNNSKRDKLISRPFLYQRRDAIIHCWELHRIHARPRFDRELSGLLGRPPSDHNWQAPAFHRLAESIEATALRRQAPRWQGV